MSCGDIFLALIAVLFPPVAVWIKSGICTADSLINIGLCCLGYLPGLIHAWYIIAKYPEYEYDGYEPIRGSSNDPEQGHGGRRGDRVTYYYVSHAPPGTQGGQGGGAGRQAPPPPQQQQQQQRGYGTTTTGGGNEGQATSSEGQGQARPPPTYAEAVRGDNKIQTQD